jgi:hypothetical protein
VLLQILMRTLALLQILMRTLALLQILMRTLALVQSPASMRLWSHCQAGAACKM